jgi:hypothetical protein
MVGTWCRPAVGGVLVIRDGSVGTRSDLEDEKRY